MFPIAIVAVASGAGMLDVASLALDDQQAYSTEHDVPEWLTRG